MRDFKQKGTRLENKEAPVEIGTSLCSGDSEDGTFFGSNGGYIKLGKLGPFLDTTKVCPFVRTDVTRFQRAASCVGYPNLFKQVYFDSKLKLLSLGTSVSFFFRSRIGLKLL